MRVGSEFCCTSFVSFFPFYQRKYKEKRTLLKISSRKPLVDSKFQVCWNAAEATPLLSCKLDTACYQTAWMRNSIQYNK